MRSKTRLYRLRHSRCHRLYGSRDRGLEHAEAHKTVLCQRERGVA
jgi:hypothetical protein